MKTFLVMILISISLPDSNDTDFLRQALDCIKDPNCLAQWRLEYQAENLLKIAEPIEPNESRPKAAPWGAVPLEYQLTLMDLMIILLMIAIETCGLICMTSPR